MSKSKKGTPEFVQWMGPLLDGLRALGGSAKPNEVLSWIVHALRLPSAIMEATLKSCGVRFHNQVHWARQYLVWEGLLEDSNRDVQRRQRVSQRLAWTRRKGIFITAERFTTDAESEATRDGVVPLELIDGEQLVQLFQDKYLGVKPKLVYAIGHAFFDESRRRP